VTDIGPLHGLTPLQRRTLDALRRSPEPVVFDTELVGELEHDIVTAFESFAERLGDETVFVSKHTLSSVLGCEVQHLHPDPFAWSPVVASGQVAHRAIQLMVHWRGEPVPADVVDDALARLADDDNTLGDWIAGLTAADEADLRGLAVERVTKFSECFPPLDKRATPMTEARVQWPLDGPILMSGKVDLVLGRPVGNESRKVIIDLKTGRPAQRHREDLRFYALIETLRTGVPPRRLASFYLDVGQPVIEDVTAAVLRSAVRRTLDGVNALIQLTVEQRIAVKRVGHACRWCPLNESCEEGRSYLAGDDDARGDGDVDR
jgi:PD-(D/E)XK nuclease superfamily